MRIHRRRNDEQGASLVMVLVFTSIFGLVAAALLTGASASMKYTNTVAAHDTKVYNADAGVQAGIAAVRQNNELCAGTSSTATSLAVGTINGSNVSVTCQGVSGSTLGASGYAVIVKSTAANAFTSQSGNAKSITGPIYVSGGLSLNKDIDVIRGNFYHLAGANSCTLGASAPGNVVVQTSGYGYYCTNAAPPDPAHVKPGSPPTTHAPSAPSGSCTIWYPGYYSGNVTVPSGDNYFVSGLYLFDGTVDVKGNLWGGQPSSTETAAISGMPSCAKDPSGVSGTGVQFAFSGAGNLYVEKTAQVELYARNDPSGTGTNGLSMVAVPSDWSGWTPSTAGTTVLNTANGNGADFAIHGLIYAPSQDIQLYATNTNHAAVLGGVVASTLTMQSSASAQNMEVSVVAGSPDPRHVTIRATAPGTTSGDKSVVSTAVVAFENDSTKTPSVESWRTRGPSDAS